MSIGKSIRFRILARDGFTCRYCGRCSPVVELEVDHIHPRSQGGKDEEENLVSACKDCNRGKGARLLPAPVGAVPAGVSTGEPAMRRMVPHPDTCHDCYHERGVMRMYPAEWEAKRGSLGYVAYYICAFGHRWNCYWDDTLRWPAEDILAEVEYVNCRYAEQEMEAAYSGS